MSLLNHVPSKGRVYVRRFDHDEARERFAAGETLPELAAAYGVSVQGVRRVVVDGVAESMAEYSRGWRSTTCEICNGPAMRLVQGKRKQNPDGRVLCNKCRNVVRRTAVLLDEEGRVLMVQCSTVDCANGERWQSPSAFVRGRRYRDLRAGGFSGQCRACLTRARQAYRDAHKVPCETCGAPCLPPSEKGTNGSSQPRCRECFYESQRASAEAVPTHKERDQSVA